MNERIRKLAEQARLMAEGHPDGSSPYHDALDDFAQLIVAECLYLCESTAVGQDAEAIQEAIKEHFGVEE